MCTPLSESSTAEAWQRRWWQTDLEPLYNLGGGALPPGLCSLHGRALESDRLDVEASSPTT